MSPTVDTTLSPSVVSADTSTVGEGAINDMKRTMEEKEQEDDSNGAKRPKKGISGMLSPLLNSNKNTMSRSSPSSSSSSSASKRIPNIAEELAMNRNHVKGSSPSPTSAATANSTNTSKTTTENSKKTTSQTSTSSTPATAAVKRTTKPKPRARAKPKDKDTTASNTKQKTLLPKSKKVDTIPADNSTVVEPEAKMKQVKIASLLTSPNTDNIPSTSSTKTIDSVSTTAANTNVTLKTETPLLKTEPTLKKTQSNLSSNKKGPSSITPAAKAKKSKSTGVVTTSSSSLSNSTEPKKKSNVNSNKKKSEQPNAEQNLLKQEQEKKKIALIAPPSIEEPTVLKKSSDSNSKISVINIPLYSTTSNDYLDENGTVTFNLFKILTENKENDEKSKKQKRKKLIDETTNDNDNDNIESTDEDDELDEDNDEEVDLDAEENKIPKKKSHPMKGKSLIGKYDFEDPFIDDSELLWEEQRASTKDGFFVYFGPLIEKGTYASFERANGTMKKGGIRK
ncbi:hypothetical protein KAFR_0G02290 [Kazachstania africana CBS 2517]|uniref:Hpc2-related domain-containing protein n=1 Tax=Kazachstania africana (strain ATCC 22294 / BCRC 22015 / CBS 2517 / CECT 1963 / NBRC 1671 / NRRL Y-8276) TaxID=1071382 RepID=H2AY13_KAZAF|nr:hypothetical protein KAFR_0G02290 [Kazachstania africana CBS 2517]CCF59263.1 hypothetical protein KAFR_0G02290 [Kazachstania africana CBS 2517]